MKQMPFIDTSATSSAATGAKLRCYFRRVRQHIFRDEAKRKWAVWDGDAEQAITAFLATNNS